MDVQDASVMAAAKLLLEHIAKSDNCSPILKELWPIYWNTEARHLDSAQRSEWAWRVLRGLKGSDGIALEDREAVTITTEIAEEIRTQLRTTVSSKGKPYSPATVNRHLIVLRRFLNWAHETRRIPYNPLICLAMEAENNIRRTKIRTEEELEQLLSAGNKIVKALVLTLFDSGIRRGEALALRRDQVIKKANGGAVIELTGDQTKTDESRRPRLTRRAVEALEAIPSSGPYYFAKPSGKRYCERYVYTMFQRAVAKSGLKGVGDESVTLHTLRHSFAYVRRVVDRWPERLIMKQGGWKTDATFRRYGDTDEYEEDRAMDELESRLDHDPDDRPR